MLSFPTAPLPPLSMQVEALISEGVNPYKYTFPRSHRATHLQHLFKDLPAGQVATRDWLREQSLEEGFDSEGDVAGEGVHVAVAGRVMARRVMGKLAFLTVQDEESSVQVRNKGWVRRWSMMRPAYNRRRGVWVENR